MIKADKEKIEKIENIVTRGVERIFPNEDFLRTRLNSGERLTIYLGIDPTGPTLHMGHMIPLIKLSQLQELGHKIILLIGDFTARIGDPDKSQARTQLTHAEVLENCKLYKEQASSVLKFDGENPAELKYNNDWLGKMNFEDVLNLASQMTVQRMLDRDMFRRRFWGTVICPDCRHEMINKQSYFSGEYLISKKRYAHPSKTYVPTSIESKKCEKCFCVLPELIPLNKQSPIYLHEFMYPLMQGYDSVAMNVDGEVGGNDQTFNMLVGRDLLKNQNPPKEKFVIPMKLLVDSKGEKMGKTTGNMLSFLDSADEKFKKIMTWSDDMLLLSFELLTDISLDEVKKRLASNENPRDIKFDLALSIVSRFHGEEEAAQAKELWIKEVQQDSIPSDIPEISLLNTFVETLAEGSGESRGQIKRLLKEGAVKINGEKVFDGDFVLNLGDIIQIGKKRWFKIKA